MSKSAIIFFFFSFAMLLVAFVMEGGVITALLQPTAAMIVFGGTIGVVGLSFPFSTFAKTPKLFLKVFSNPSSNREEMADYILEISALVRKEGLLALESEINSNRFHDDFLTSALQMITDGIDSDTLQHILKNRIIMMEERHSEGIAVFESAGGYAPTMGVIGTVMGLISVLGDLSDPTELGSKIALAFIATLYGVGSANLIWLPVATKLKELTNREAATKYMIIEGISMIQNGSNPAMIKENLKGYLENGKKGEERGE